VRQIGEGSEIVSQLDIKIRKLQDNGSTFRANIETLYLGGVRSAKVDRLHFEVPEEWKACTISLHVRRLSGTLPDPQILDENNSALVDRRWTLEKEGTWMLLAINDSGYIAMTKPGKYTCYDTIDTDTTTENITPSIYEQFVAEVTKYAKQALESMNAAKASETNAKTSETNAKASADKAKASADSMDTSVATCTTKAKEAEASAVRAKTSETNAKTSETNAKASENAAKASETNAKASENAAKSSETKSAASEKNAKTSETAAKQALKDTQTEHTTALQDIARARTTALNDVAASTKTATTAANTATQQATAAAGSASTAATKAGEASTSAGAAFNSRQAAEKAQKAAENAAELAGTRAGTDKTLSVDGAPADAKTVGDKFKSIKTDWNSVTDKPSTFPPSAHTHSYAGSSSAGGDATRALGVKDYAGSQTIEIGYASAGLTTSNLTHIAGYTDNGTKIKDVSKDVLKSWLGVTNPYPVGSIYISTSSTSPASLFGGTWESIASERVLMGVSSSHGAGSTVSAGLPNITGETTAMTTWRFVTPSGAFATASSQPGPDGYGNNLGLNVNFYASRCSSVYGNSSTVQPAAYYVYMWRRTA
jgi:hypothetical protein